MKHARVLLRLDHPQEDELAYAVEECLRLAGYEPRKLRDGEDPGQEFVLTNVRRSGDGPRVVLFDPDPAWEVFDRLTLRGEARRGLYDPHGRLRAETMGPSRKRPVTDEWSRTLRAALETAGCSGSPRKSPVALLSHDVDKTSNRDVYSLAGKILGVGKSLLRGDPAAGSRSWRSLALALSGRETYHNFDRIMRLEADRGMRSSFYFMLGQSGLHGTRYSFRSVQPVIRRLAESGWEVGLHVNYYRSKHLETVRSHRQRLEDCARTSVVGARFHWLRFDPRGSFELLRRAGFGYDTTLGFFDGLGYRVGTAEPYFVYDPAARRAGPFVEIPLLVMDATLFEYLRLSPAQAWETCRNILDVTGEHCGTVSLLWHTNVFEDPLFEGWGWVYEQTLDYLRDNRFEVKTGRQVWEELQMRSSSANA